MPVDAQDLTQARELFDYLSPSRAPWLPKPRDWVFRGQRNASWGLNPSATRETALREFKCTLQADRDRRADTEAWLLHRFASLADVQGLPTPVLPESVLRDGKTRDRSEAWIPERLWTLAALAQHYGVPTRLLDWSRKPLVAAWFAAEGAAREEHKTPGSVARFAVWALRRRDPALPPTVQLVRAPRASNANLHLQSGLFTLCTDEVALEHQPVELVKRTLPVGEAGPLLGLLAHEFVQGATVYAGYDGVRRSMEEARFRG